MPGTGVTAFGNAPKRNCDHCGREWNVDEECPAPGGMLNKLAAKNRSNGCCDGGEPRPSPDRLPAGLRVEACTDDRQAAGHEKSGSDALDTPRDYQLLNVQAKTASNRSNRENPYANQKHPSAAKQIAERPADKNQSCQEQPIRLDHPLHTDDSCVEACLERR